MIFGLLGLYGLHLCPNTPPSFEDLLENQWRLRHAAWHLRKTRLEISSSYKLCSKWDLWSESELCTSALSLSIKNVKNLINLDTKEAWERQILQKLEDALQQLCWDDIINMTNPGQMLYVINIYVLNFNLCLFLRFGFPNIWPNFCLHYKKTKHDKHWKETADCESKHSHFISPPWKLVEPSLFPRCIFLSESGGPSSLTLFCRLWMLSCDQIPHWDADGGPTCLSPSSWLWRQPPGLFVLPSVISAHHLEQRLTGSAPPFHTQLHSHFTSLQPYCAAWTSVKARSVEIHNDTVLVQNASDTNRTHEGRRSQYTYRKLTHFTFQSI